LERRITLTFQKDKHCDKEQGYCGLEEDEAYVPKTKKIEIYVFIDPLCPECWGLEPMLKKLLIEYGRYFTIRYVLSSKLKSHNQFYKKNIKDIADVWEKTASRSGMSCDSDILYNQFPSLYTASLAIKAAELQGKRLGIRFLRRLRELLFVQKQNITDESILATCAKEAGLDKQEFLNDLHSKSAKKALQCDMDIKREMDVEENPTLVFFNEKIEDERIKVTGYYDYPVYVQILEEIVGEQLKPDQPPPLIEFMERFQFVATRELSMVYGVTCEEMENKMKRYLIQQLVDKVPMKHGTFWRYVENKA
jgi:predicted DsbA family dithiol-disulfide isomerase